MPARPHDAEDIALSLTLAVVEASPAPLLLLDGDLTVVAASRSFTDAFEGSHAHLVGQSLYAMGSGGWDSPQLRALMTATVAGSAAAGVHDFEVRRNSRRRHLIIQARKLAYLDLAQTRILLAVSDVTDSMVTENALKQVTVLLREVRHRVANSLQIIASVLLQNARKTGSEETRVNLQDAHRRVMSVAALERLLSASEDGEVDVHAYFTSLCQSISTSMISNQDQVALTVEGGAGAVEARVLVSLGLIVTELVINALKHAFPGERRGRIVIDYNFHGPNWVVCVRDDGVGLPSQAAVASSGLGTSIVQALAGQLDAIVYVVPKHPGVQVSIHHTQIALVAAEVKVAGEPLALSQAQPGSPAS